MKKIFLFLALALLLTSANAKTIVLPANTDENGNIVVENVKNKVKDKIHIINNTDFGLEVVVFGESKTGDKMEVASGFVRAHDSEFITADFEDKLSTFKTFTISLKDGKVNSYNAEMAWSDLHFEINQVSGLSQKSESFSAADELLKWKKLLDEGVITKEEFDAKKKTLLEE